MVSGQPVDILPFGHTYTLTETKSPTGYKNPTATYEVRIAYGVNYINGSTDPLTVKNTPLTPATVQLSGTKTVDGKATVTHEQEEHINSGTTIINHPVAQVDLFGTKRMIGRPLQGDDYAFVLEEVIADPSGTTTTKKIDDASCGSDGLFAFDPLVFDYQDEGIHTYNIREIIPAEANAENGYQYQGVTYDPSVYTVIVTVDVEEDHQVNVSTAYMKNDTAVPGVVFNNVYTIKGSTKVTFSGTKTMADTSDRGLRDKEYVFDLYNADEDFNPVGTPVETVFNAENGAFSFTPITHTSRGTFCYVVKERDQGLGGITYSQSIYKLMVKVEDNGIGGLKATVTEHSGSESVQISSSQSDTIVDVTNLDFENCYTILGDVSVTLSGTKALEGRDLKAGEFSFTLTEVPTSGNPTTIETVTNDADGKFAFAPLKYTKNDLGTHEYTIKETSGSAGGVNYDTSIYSITIEVVDDGFGGLVAASTVEKDGHPSSDLLFQNEYTVTGQVEVPLTGTKTLSNAALKEGQFHFQLYAANENFQADGEALETVANNAAGHIAFTNLTFDPTDIGTHYYVIREKDEGKAGFTYDSGEYHVTITIGHDGEGNTTQDTVIRKAGSTSSVTSFAFSNAYEDPADTVLKLDVTKRIQSTSRRRTIAPDGFRFRLVNADNAAEAYTAVSDKDGKATFSLSYTHEDLGKTFTYTLTEDKGDIKNVTYSTDSYTIKVSIWLDETTNTLKATILRDGTEIPENTPVAEFVNRYRPPFSVIPDTGDSSHIFLWFTALATSAALLLCLLLWRRRKA